MKKRLLSALLTFCMLLTLLPVSAVAAGKGNPEDDASEELTYIATAEEFDDISRLNLSSTNNHTLAYAIWTDTQDNYFVAVLAMKETSGSQDPGRSYTYLTVNSNGEMPHIQRLEAQRAANDLNFNSNKNTKWWIVQFTEDEAKEAFDEKDGQYYLDVNISPGGHQLDKIFISKDFVNDTEIDESDNPDEPGPEIEPQATAITIQVMLNGAEKNWLRSGNLHPGKPLQE